MASTSNNRRWTKGGEADLVTCECLVLGAMGCYEKPEALRAKREPEFAPFSLDQFRRALTRNLLEIENEEGSKCCNSIFARFVQWTF